MSRAKRSTPKPTVNLQLEAEDTESLRELALSLGYTAKSGIVAGKGNLSGLMSAISQAHKRDPESAIALLKVLLRSP